MTKEQAEQTAAELSAQTGRPHIAYQAYPWQRCGGWEAKPDPEACKHCGGPMAYTRSGLVCLTNPWSGPCSGIYPFPGDPRKPDESMTYRKAIKRRRPVVETRPADQVGRELAKWLRSYPGD